MNNVLIVLTCDSEQGASRVLEGFETGHGHRIAGLENAVVVIKDSTGLIAAYQQWELPATPVTPGSQMSSRFAEALFGGFPKIKINELVAAGLDQVFLVELVDTLNPSGSALLIFVPSGTLVDTRQILDDLSQYKGVLHHTTFPNQVMETIEKLT